MSRKDHDPEDRSSSDWLDKLFKISGVPGPIMGGKTQAQADAEKEYKTHRSQPKRLPPKRPEDWVAPDEVTPDDDGTITVTVNLNPEPSVKNRPTPPAPEGVVVHLVDGSRRVAEVVWVGTSLEGVEMWEVTARYKFDEIKRITIDFLPAGTEVHIGGSGGPSTEG